MTSFVKFSFTKTIYRINHVKGNNVIKVTNYEKNCDGQQNEQSPPPSLTEHTHTHTHTKQKTTTNSWLEIDKNM